MYAKPLKLKITQRYMFVAVLALLVALGYTQQPVHAQSTPCAQLDGGQLTLDGYEQCVREAYAAARSSDRISLDEIVPRLTADPEVRLPDGTSVPVDNAWFVAAMALEPPDYQLIEARLGAIIDGLSQARAAQNPDALNKLDEVFSRPPFESREAPSAWTRFWRGVGQAIEAFFDWLFNTGPGSNPGTAPATGAGSNNLSPVGWVLLIIGLLLVLGLVLYAIRGVRGSLIREAKIRAEAALEDEHISANEALDRAQTEARSGDYRTAVRYLYLSSLLWLDERKLVRYDRSLTNREYLQEARANPALHDRLAPVVNTFDRVWYGHRDLEEQDFRAYEEQVQDLRNMEAKS